MEINSSSSFIADICAISVTDGKLNIWFTFRWYFGVENLWFKTRRENLVSIQSGSKFDCQLTCVSYMNLTEIECSRAMSILWFFQRVKILQVPEALNVQSYYTLLSMIYWFKKIFLFVIIVTICHKPRVRITKISYLM